MVTANLATVDSMMSLFSAIKHSLVNFEGW